MRVLVVLPTYNEAENLDKVVRRIRSALDAATILVVDDGSPDGTADIAEVLGKELGNVEVMRRSEKSGLGSAYRAGFRWGIDNGFEACVEMDADLSHDPEALPSLIAPLDAGHDLVIGSRYVRGGSIPDWTWHRRLLSRGETSMPTSSSAWGWPIQPPGSGPTGARYWNVSISTGSGPTATGSRSR